MTCTMKYRLSNLALLSQELDFATLRSRGHLNRCRRPPAVRDFDFVHLEEAVIAFALAEHLSVVINPDSQDVLNARSRVDI